MRSLVFDWETTGLVLHPRTKDHLQPRAIEFGGVILPDWERISFLINPGIPLSKEITEITRITDDNLRDRPRFPVVLPQLVEAFGKVDIMIAHNLPFDETILRLELARCGAENTFPFPKHKLCTVQCFEEIYGGKLTLQALYKWVIGKPLAQTHRAADDCEALAEIVMKEGLADDFSSAA